MKKLIRLVTLCAFALAGMAEGRAQQGRTELHISPTHFESLFKDDGFAPVALRVSFERELGHRMVYGLDAHILWRSIVGEDAQDKENNVLEYDGQDVYYLSNKREWGLMYRTAYYIKGDADGGTYLGSTIGFRRVSREILVDNSYNYSYYYSSGNVPFKQRYSATRTLVPVGVRIGFRGVYMYGGETDFYFGLAYQFGGGTNMFSEPEVQDAHAVPARVIYSMGFSWIIDLD